MTIRTLATVLSLKDGDVADLTRKIDEARGFQAVEVKEGLTYEQFAGAECPSARTARASCRSAAIRAITPPDLRLAI